MRLAALFSGGKDSTYSIMKAIDAGHEIKYLITLSPKREDSWMFHHPCIDLTKFQAEAMRIKQLWKDTEGEKEKELEDLKSVIASVKDEVDGILSGAIASNYQKFRIETICNELNLKSVTPLWGMYPEELIKEEVKAGLKFAITAVAARGLDQSWLGRIVDLDVVNELIYLKKKFGLNPVFEGGEAETFVIDCPLFKFQVDLCDFEKSWDEKTESGRIIVKSACLRKKG